MAIFLAKTVGLVFKIQFKSKISKFKFLQQILQLASMKNQDITWQRDPLLLTFHFA